MTEAPQYLDKATQSLKALSKRIEHGGGDAIAIQLIQSALLDLWLAQFEMQKDTETTR